jgi:HK97 family phage portal protein
MLNKLKTLFKKSISFTGVQSFSSPTSWLNWGSTGFVEKGYKQSAWIYSAVNLRAYAVASVPWVVEVKRGREWDAVEDHPLHDLIQAPNMRLDGFTLFKMSVQHLDLTGNAYWLKVRNLSGSQVIQLVPILPGKIAPVIVADQLIRYQGADGRNYPIEDIVHLMYTTPDSLYVGMSPLQAAARAAEIDREAENWQKKSFENRAIPDGVMIIEDIQTQQQYETARAAMKEQYQGSENSRTPLLIGGKANWQTMSQTAAEMDFINSRKFTREEILSVYGVPQPMVGVYENATLANIETARKIFWRDTVIPMLDEIQSELNLQLASEFPGVRLRHDVSDIEAMQDSYTDTVKTAKDLWSMGVPFNELSRELELGFEDIEGGDVGYIPSGLIPADLDWSDSLSMDDAEKHSRAAYGDKTIR